MKTIDYDKFENMTDEEEEAFWDEYYRKKPCNQNKSLAPLYIYLILKQNSSFDHPLKQKDIQKMLAEHPYEVTLERKAVARIINSLCDAGLEIQKTYDGVWMGK